MCQRSAHTQRGPSTLARWAVPGDVGDASVITVAGDDSATTEVGAGLMAQAVDLTAVHPWAAGEMALMVASGMKATPPPPPPPRPPTHLIT